MTGLVDELRASLRSSPEQAAFADERGRTIVTRGELAELELRTAGALHARGLGRGDTIALAIRPGPTALAVVLAATRLRIRVALVDPMAGPDVVLARLALATPSLVIADALAQAAAGWAAPVARRAGLHLPRLRDIAPVATLGRRLPGSAPTLVGRSDRGVAAGELPDHAGDDDADAIVIFTSGTTGRPKAVVHTIGSIGAGMTSVVDFVPIDAGSRVVGSTFFVMTPALLGGACISMPARGARRLATQLQRLQPATTYLTPPAARALLDVVEASGQRLTGRTYSGSAPISSALLARLREAGADEAWGVYAMTEAFPVAAVEAQARLAWDAGNDDGGGDFVGVLARGMHAELDGNGQLLVSGPSVSDRYLGDEPHDTVATGDRARLERDGDRTRVVLEGRMKDMILRRAENIYPGLYEPALHVSGVELALLVGVPTGDLDEEVVLLVQPATGVSEHEVRSLLRAPLAGMGNATPDRVEVVREIPTSGRSRKPDRAAAAKLVARDRSAAIEARA